MSQNALFDGLELMSLGEARHVLPCYGGKKFSERSIWRWCHVGIKNRTGEVVRLRCVKVGSRLFTSKPYLEEFFAAVGTDTPKPPAPQGPPSVRLIERARKVLKARGY